MNWNVSSDTTFSDIWRGRNLRRLLTLWGVSLIALTLYGTTTNSIIVPETPPTDRLTSSHTTEIVPRYQQSALHEHEPRADEWSNLIEIMKPTISAACLVADTLAITEAVSPVIRTISRIVQTRAEHFGRATYATDISRSTQNPGTL